MSETRRLPAPAGLLLDRSREVSVEFEGERMTAIAGDTLASALAAHGRHMLSRSFKYHRPRGILTAAGQDANTLVQLPRDPNAAADTTPVRDGMQAHAQNCVGGLERDRLALLSHLGRFLPVGFYYRAFFRPRGIWNRWARLFRRMAGLGVIDRAGEPDEYDKQYLFCDVLVVGAGPAGMTAALECAQAGKDVVLVDEQPLPGGSLNYLRDAKGAEHGASLAADLRARIHADPNIRVYTNATANGYYADNWVAIVSGRRLYKLRAADVIVCSGAHEQHAVFRNNDLPGVMMGTAAQRLIRLYAVRPGRRAVVLTGNDQGYGVALDLLDTGVGVVAVVELRQTPGDGPLAGQLRRRGVPVRTGHAVYEARGARHLEQVEVREIVADGRCAERGEVLDCDLLCMSVGFVPTYQLACQAGARLDYDDAHDSFSIVGLPQGLHLAGAVNGRWDLESTCADAETVARAVCGETVSDAASRSRADTLSVNFRWPIFPHPRGKEFVDFDEDLQIADIVNAVADGYDSVELVKRFSTCGMGPSQGRHSALAMARLVARATGRSVAETGVTTARPPFAAEKLGHVAGRRFYPANRSSMHHRHQEAGAQWLQAGNWYRPAYYGEAGEREKAIRREVRAVRQAVGLVDVSTLGGIEIRGAEAGEFMNRVYTMGFAKLPVGRTRYALMTNEAGVVIDDGVACRIADGHHYVTATTGGVQRVYQTMLKWQAQWRLDIDIANVTSAWCGVNLAGPRSRDVLRRACDDLDLSPDGFPYLGYREGRVAGAPARLLRVGFVGELGYEIHVPQMYGEALWDALMHAGRDDGIVPFGIEAQRILRLEKGHIIVGQDTDAMSNPMELGMNWALGKNKPFYIGQRTLTELAARPLTRSLIGFAMDDPDGPIPAESHLVIEGSEMIGRVTSAAYSEALGRGIGLAYVPPQLAAPGSAMTIRCDAGLVVPATVTNLPFYDPEGLRQQS